MQLEYICDMELVYREESLYKDKFLLVRPYGGEEGMGYGEGGGSGIVSLAQRGLLCPGGTD